MKDKILELRTNKNLIILAHYYVAGEIQEVADYVGDSLGLSQQAAETDADIIIFAGVHFMAETAKILSPQKKVIIPDLTSGCPLADSMPTQRFIEFLKDYPEHVVITYVNATAEIKALSDITCTSSNAVEIVNSLPEDSKIIFGPDKNLGGYINGITGREMVLWDGFCPVHENFSFERFLKLKEKFPKAKILAHPECNRKLLLKADVIGSTSRLLKETKKYSDSEFIIATEPGIFHEMQKANPTNKYIPVPPNNPKQELSVCINMKKHSLQKLYDCIKNEGPEINLSEDLIEKAKKPIVRMLNISKKLGL